MIKGDLLAKQDYYVLYDFEDVAFRWDHQAGKAFRLFIGDASEKEVPQDNRLLNDALRYGVEITAEQYRGLAGKHGKRP